MTNRVFKICNTWKIFHEEIDNLKAILAKNQYPPHLVERHIEKFLDSKFADDVDNEDINENIVYIKLPYLGEYSQYVTQKVGLLCKKFCKNTRIKISF